ncbi:class I SAM-dependent methyltransferase [Thiocapsa roseopersicina]|uniref:Methyltransferase domain-containing protein n=1 Tax=Thiocapsa roseopersicina TaxID=1058 RepID=A0A1H2QCF7_THIRO|nr:class I SAM-dependent methyltransferase [Thiocapsa roseopersicina]SDW04851.1 Methyltransferase domain-containing protein [Thiocapsa roseopersicina]
MLDRPVKDTVRYHRAEDGILEPSTPVQHRDDEYPEDGFATLWAMQERHFWYRGRHRFLLRALDRHHPVSAGPLSAVDLGGGVGGWVRFLADRRPGQYRPLALADSSRTALRMAGSVLPEGVERYQIDLMNLGWRDHWDVAFLLDVIEHLPDDLEALCQARDALRPGGLLFVTTPALRQFWSYNDDLAHHLRRYTRADFARLGEQAGLALCDARYFMFFLSPLYYLARRRPGIMRLSEDQKRALIIKSHRIPSPPINAGLTFVFASETPVGHWIRFPFGTSILGVFRKP